MKKTRRLSIAVAIAGAVVVGAVAAQASSGQQVPGSTPPAPVGYQDADTSWSPADADGMWEWMQSQDADGMWEWMESHHGDGMWEWMESQDAEGMTRFHGDAMGSPGSMMGGATGHHGWSR